MSKIFDSSSSSVKSFLYLFLLSCGYTMAPFSSYTTSIAYGLTKGHRHRQRFNKNQSYYFISHKSHIVLILNRVHREHKHTNEYILAWYVWLRLFHLSQPKNMQRYITLLRSASFMLLNAFGPIFAPRLRNIPFQVIHVIGKCNFIVWICSVLNSIRSVFSVPIKPFISLLLFGCLYGKMCSRDCWSNTMYAM